MIINTQLIHADDKWLADELRSLDARCVSIAKELERRGYLIDDENYEDVEYVNITRIYRPAKDI